MNNQPYVKEFKNGIVSNPIIDSYSSGPSQRKMNRGHERIIKHSTMRNKKKEPVLMFQYRTKRGFWRTLNFINT